MWFKFSRERQPVLHLRLDIAFAILAPLGIKAEHILHLCSWRTEFLREFEQIQKCLVCTQQFQIAVKHRDTLIDKIK